MTELDAALSELVALARACRADHAKITPATFGRFDTLLRQIRFAAITAPAQVREAETRSIQSLPRSDAPFTCSVLDCNAGFPLYNIAFNVGQLEWRCGAHLPPNLLNPIGLHGAAREATGRRR